MENGAFAPKEQMLHFLYYFQVQAISKALKGVIMGLRFKISLFRTLVIRVCNENLISNLSTKTYVVGT